MSHPNHAATYVAGEEADRLQSAAQYFGIKNTRAPLRPVRVAAQPPTENTSSSNNSHSKSILKFGSTVWSNVGLLFSDSTLEAARMHSVGVMAQEERVAGDGTLHLMSISRRKKGTEPSYKDLMDLFHQKPLEPLEIVRETEDDEYEEVVLDSVEGGSLTAAIFGIVKGMVGPAVLYLPRGFALSGYAVAIPSMIMATITYVYSATRLLQCWKVESDKNRILAEKMEELRALLDPEGTDGDGGSKSQYGAVSNVDPHFASMDNSGQFLTYPELARRAFGKFSFLISGGIAAMQFGVCLTYLIFVPQNLVESTRALFGVEVSKQVFLAGMLLMEIPLVWIRDIRKLTPFNIVATFFIAFGLASVLFIALFGTDGVSDATDQVSGGEMYQLYEEVTHLPSIKPSWVLFIGTSFFCFEGSITLLVPLQEAVYKKEDRDNFPNVNRRVTSSIVCFYIIFAVICWASFGDSVQTALTASLPKSALSTIVQFAYSIAVIFTFPLQAFPALEVVCHTTGTKVGKAASAATFKRNMTASAIVCFLGVLAVIAIDYLGNVVSLLGSLVGIPIALVYPPLMHNQLVTSSKTTRFLNYCLSSIGFIAAVAASYTTITSWDEGAEG